MGLAIRKRLGEILSDVVIACLAMVAAYYINFWSMSLASTMRYRPNLPYVCLMVSVFTVAMNYVCRVYASLWQHAGVDDVLWVVISGVCTGLLYLLASKVVQWHPPSLSVYLLFPLMLICGMVGIRLVFRTAIRFRGMAQRFSHNRQIKMRNVLVCGAGDTAARVIRNFVDHPHYGYRVVGVLDRDPSMKGSRIAGVKILGSWPDILPLVKQLEVDEVIIAMSEIPARIMVAIWEQCRAAHVPLRTMRGGFDDSGNSSLNRMRDIQIEDLLGRQPVSLDIERISGYLTGKVVLVTGGGGSIGSELCRQIAGFHPSKLLILDIYENDAFDLQQELRLKDPELDFEVIIASIRDRGRLESVFDTYRPEVVFHAAAHKHVPLMELNPTEAIKNNIFGTYNVAECADRYGAKRFVLISSDKAVNPTNIMGATKRVAEMIIQTMNTRSQTEFAAVRFGNVLGSHGSVVPLFRRQIENGGPVTLTHPDMRRFFMTIPEAVQLVIQCGAMAKGGEIFMLDMGKPVRIMDLAEDMIRLSGYEPNVDIQIVVTGLRPGEKIVEELMTQEEGTQATAHDQIFVAQPTALDPDALQEELQQLRWILSSGAGPQDVFAYMEQMVPTYHRDKRKEA